VITLSTEHRQRQRDRTYFTTELATALLSPKGVAHGRRELPHARRKGRRAVLAGCVVAFGD